MIALLSPLDKTVEKAISREIALERRGVLQDLINYIQHKIDQSEPVNLNFICTHNSRRSQFSQIWAHTAAAYFGVPASCYSGGVEVTAFNERAVASATRSGFLITASGDGNPRYELQFSAELEPIIAFSKLFDDPVNSATKFAAVMTCSHADENCPFIPGTEQRIAVRYEDPKKFDDTELEAKMYDERSMQIASEMFYVFGQIKLH